MRIVRKKPLGLSHRVMLLIITASIILVPLVPLAVKGALVYTSRPEFCIACHMMKSEYNNWTHSPHRNWSGCSDCHVPQQSFVTKSAGKTRDGIYHSYAYLMDKDPLSIRISKHGEETVLTNCIRCHQQMVSNIVHDKDRKCWDCHKSVFHAY
ncbi:MAG: cytochrome c nitrite reductase small subunit [Nitrospirae bacterium]|nr:cytochrome c nitrite reductase small subunit [Nitrospirota bacterium]